MGNGRIRGVDRREPQSRLGNVGHQQRELIVAHVLTDVPKSGGDLTDQRGTTRVAVRRRPGPVTLVVRHAGPARKPGARRRIPTKSPLGTLPESAIAARGRYGFPSLASGWFPMSPRRKSRLFGFIRPDCPAIVQSCPTAPVASSRTTRARKSSPRRALAPPVVVACWCLMVPAMDRVRLDKFTRETWKKFDAKDLEPLKAAILRRRQVLAAPVRT